VAVSLPARTIGVACCVLLSACGGGRETGESQKAVGGAAPTTGPAGPHGAPPASGSVTTTLTSRPSTAPPAATSPPGAPAPAPPAPGTPAEPEEGATYATGASPGKYVYDVSGTASGGLTPTNQAVRGRSVLTVDPRRDQDQRFAWVSDLSSRPPQEQVLRFLPEGVYLVHLRVGGGLKEFAPRSPLLGAPTSPAAGPWSWVVDSTDGTTRLAGSFRYRGTEAVPVGGRSVLARVIEGELRFTGAIVGTVSVTRWFSVADALDVKTREVTDFTAPAPNRDDLTSVLQSLTTA
jgi:hypothetical protein